MWRAYTSLGFLEYSFLDCVEAMNPIFIIRVPAAQCSRQCAHHADHSLDELNPEL